MASTSEGRNAIEAAKLRLAAAKSQTLATSKTLASAEASEACAKQMAEAATKNARAAATTTQNAKEQAVSCRKEMEEAEKFLKDAEKRWEVIEVDDDELDFGEKDDRRSAKRRKVSLSPAGNNNDNANNNDARASGNVVSPTGTPPHTAHQPSSNGRTRVSSPRGNDLREGSNAVNGNNDQVDEPNIITVEGCGNHAFNGRYKKNKKRHDGSPIYAMKGQWMGNAMNFLIRRGTHPSTGAKVWVIRFSKTETTRTAYYVHCEGDLPPKVGWRAKIRGAVQGSHAPQLKW